MQTEEDFVLYACIRERVYPRRREILEADKRQMIQWILERDNVWKDLVRSEIVSDGIKSCRYPVAPEWIQFNTEYQKVLEDLRKKADTLA